MMNAGCFRRGSVWIVLGVAVAVFQNGASQEKKTPIFPSDSIPESLIKELTAGKAPLKNMSDELLDTLRTGGAIYQLKDATFLLHWRVEGDRGSYTDTWAEAEGLYLHVAPHLSFSRRFSPGTKNLQGNSDRFFYWPRKLRIRTQSNVKIHHVFPAGSWVFTSDWSHDETVTPPPPPSKALAEKRFTSLQEWRKWKLECSEWAKNNPSLSLLLEDRRASGGQISVYVDSELSVVQQTKAVSKKSSIKNSQKVSVQFDNRYLLKSDAVPPVNWKRITNRDLHSVKTVDFKNFKILKNGSSENLKMGPNPSNAEVLSDRQATESYSYYLGSKIDVNATLEPLSSGEEKWMPVAREERSYRLTLDKPSADKVEKVRFKLDGTTSYPGVCSNAGNHCYQDEQVCPDCGNSIPQKLESRIINVFPGTKGEYVYSRDYWTRVRSKCVLDDLQDLYFRDDQNPGYKLEKSLSPDGLAYRISQRLSRDKMDSQTYDVTVTIQDGAASSRLSAEVLVNGFWYPVKAKGPTASASGEALFLPNDQNGDNVADVWTQQYGDQLHGDQENQHNQKFPGDGLTSFEEYRGFKLSTESVPVRLNPETTDVFLFDYSGTFFQSIQEAKAKLATSNSGLTLHSIDENTIDRDVMNWCDTQYKAGPQYVVVLEKNSASPDLIGPESYQKYWSRWAGLSTSLGPPNKNNNTVFMQVGRYAPKAEKVADVMIHEIGHLLGVRHHGRSDFRIDVDEKQAKFLSTAKQFDFSRSSTYQLFVATEGGQHSGNRECWMGYKVADLFCSGEEVELTPESASLFQPWPESPKMFPGGSGWPTQNRFCKSKQGNGLAGDSGKGCGCQEQLRIRSY